MVAPSLALWALVLVVGLGTLAFRLSFVEAFASAEGVPPNVRAALRYVPPAVLAALVLPAFLHVDGSLMVGPGTTVSSPVASPPSSPGGRGASSGRSSSG